MIEKWKKGTNNRKKYGTLLSYRLKAFNCLEQDLIIADFYAYIFSHKYLEMLNDCLVGRKKATE